MYPRIGSGILMVPVGEIPSKARALVKPDEEGKFEVYMTLCPAGDPGYDIAFSTQRSFSEVISGFREREVINPKSIVCCNDNEVGWYQYRLEDLSPETINRLSQNDGLLLMLKQYKNDGPIEEFDPTKLTHWFYESKNPFFSGKIFAVNLAKYDERVLEVAYQFTDYKVNDEDKGMIRAKLNEDKSDLETIIN